MVIIPITSNSTIDEINKNFQDISTAISSKQLSFHYLDLYTLKGSVAAKTSAITLAYNLLNLNEALLIVVNPDEDDTKPAEEEWRNMTLYAGDYLVKTMAGPLRIPGPTTGYYIPDVDGTELTYTYRIIEPTEGDEIDPVNIQGASGGGYDLTYTTLAVNTPKSFPAQYNNDSVLIIPIIQIYDSNTLIDYPYTLIDYPYTLDFNDTTDTYTLTLDGAWANKTFTVRVR